jgi:hypothetical protein
LWGKRLICSRCGSRQIDKVVCGPLQARGSNGLFIFKVFGRLQSGYIKPFSVNYWW